MNWTDYSNEETCEGLDGDLQRTRLILRKKNWTLYIYTGYELDVGMRFYFDVEVTRGYHGTLH